MMSARLNESIAEFNSSGTDGRNYSEVRRTNGMKFTVLVPGKELSSTAKQKVKFRYFIDFAGAGGSPPTFSAAEPSAGQISRSPAFDLLLWQHSHAGYESLPPRRCWSCFRERYREWTGSFV